MKDKKTLSVFLLHHGIVSHGGARHENYFGENLHRSLLAAGVKNTYKVILANRLFQGTVQHLKFLYWGWKNSVADVNIVVGRVGLSALLRSRYNRNIVLLVMHNYDRKDGKRRILDIYFNLLFCYIRKYKPRRFAVVVVAPYFQHYFNLLLPGIPVFNMPNLFDVAFYRPYIQSAKNRFKIHLGQYSSKNDASVFELAKMLTQSGYYCYFSTLFAEDVGVFADYEVKKMDFSVYLSEMASAYCTIAFTGINEGWPRLNHESILAGTPVIGYKNGGLRDLLQESDSYIVNSAQQAFDLITGDEKLEVRATEEFIQRYDVSQTETFLKPIVQFIRENKIV